MEGGGWYAMYTDEDASGAFTARLVQLGDYRFIDLYPDDTFATKYAETKAFER
jgi:hypothetical protein